MLRGDDVRRADQAAARIKEIQDRIAADQALDLPAEARQALDGVAPEQRARRLVFAVPRWILQRYSAVGRVDAPLLRIGHGGCTGHVNGIVFRHADIQMTALIAHICGAGYPLFAYLALDAQTPCG